VSASDASAGALAVAAANAEVIGVAVSFSHARGLPAGSWDLVVANLPYVRADEWTGLAPEITRYEPRGALVAGEDGLDAIRELVDVAAPGQQLLVEHAPGQAAQLRGLLAEAATHRDLAGRERATVGRRPA
jgi:release factor glutamine methyltransferase